MNEKCEIPNLTNLYYDLTNIVLVHKFNEYGIEKIKINVQISVLQLYNAQTFFLF